MFFDGKRSLISRRCQTRPANTLHEGVPVEESIAQAYRCAIAWFTRASAVGMLSKMEDLDAHEYPPPALRQLYKKYRSIKPSAAEALPGFVDIHKLDHSSLPDRICLDKWLSPGDINPALNKFMSHDSLSNGPYGVTAPVPVYTHRDIPGQQQFRIYPTRIFLSPR